MRRRRSADGHRICGHGLRRKLALVADCAVARSGNSDRTLNAPNNTAADILQSVIGGDAGSVIRVLIGLNRGFAADGVDDAEVYKGVAVGGTGAGVFRGDRAVDDGPDGRAIFITLQIDVGTGLRRGVVNPLIQAVCRPPGCVIINCIAILVCAIQRSGTARLVDLFRRGMRGKRAAIERADGRSVSQRKITDFNLRIRDRGDGRALGNRRTVRGGIGISLDVPVFDTAVALDRAAVDGRNRAAVVVERINVRGRRRGDRHRRIGDACDRTAVVVDDIGVCCGHYTIVHRTDRAGIVEGITGDGVQRHAGHGTERSGWRDIDRAAVAGEAAVGNAGNCAVVVDRSALLRGNRGVGDAVDRTAGDVHNTRAVGVGGLRHLDRAARHCQVRPGVVADTGRIQRV